MTLSALGSLDNVMILAGLDSSDEDATLRATVLLEHASAAIRNYTRLSFDEVTETVVLAGVWGGNLELPEWPVTDVDTVAINGTEVTGWEWDGARSIRRWSSVAAFTDAHDRYGGRLWRTGGSWAGPGTSITVTYTHGFSETPEDVKAISEGMVVSAMTTPTGVRQESIGSYSVTYAVEMIAGTPRITIYDAKALNRYRRRWL